MHGGLLIKEARLRAQLSQAALADLLATSQPVIARWERGTAAPSFDTVVRAVRACGLDLLVTLTPYDESDMGLIEQNLAQTPEQRLAILTNLLEVERWAHAARPVPADR